MLQRLWMYYDPSERKPAKQETELGAMQSVPINLNLEDQDITL